MSIDGAPTVKQKSSGLTVCTGTGSSSWHFNINSLQTQDIKEILRIGERIWRSSVIIGNTCTNLFFSTIHQHFLSNLSLFFNCRSSTFSQPLFHLFVGYSETISVIGNQLSVCLYFVVYFMILLGWRGLYILSKCLALSLARENPGDQPCLKFTKFINENSPYWMNHWSTNFSW